MSIIAVPRCLLEIVRTIKLPVIQTLTRAALLCYALELSVKSFDRIETQDNEKPNANLHGFFSEYDRFVFSMYIIFFDA